METAAPAKHPHALAFILITLLIDTIGFGIIIPVMPELIMTLSGEPISAAAGYAGLMLFAFAAAHFISSPVMGNLSDRFGRRPILLISLAALSVDYLIMALAPTLLWLFIGRTFSGAFGATFATANAYITDVTDEDKRPQAFGLLGAAWGLGFTLGPVIGGFLGEMDPRLPFFVTAGLGMLNVLYGYLVLPETLKQSDRRAFNWKRSNPIGALAHFHAYPVLLGLALVVILFQIAHDTNPAVFTYYVIHKFSWSETDIGIALGFVGIATIIAQTLVIRWTVARFGETNSAYIGFVAAAIGMGGFALAQEAWHAYLALIPMCLMGLAMPSVRSMMARRVPANAQGELQGALSSLMGLTMIAAPLIMTQLFRHFSSDDATIALPGAPYLLAALLMALAALLLARQVSQTEPSSKADT